MRFDRLEDWLAWLEQLHPQSIDLDLSRVGAVATQLDVCQFDARVITVAGTNGKGSTVAAIHALLTPSSARVGVYTSPHLQIFNERILLDGQFVDDQALCAALQQVDDARQSIVNDEGAAVTLSYFEFTTLAALLLFKRAGLDYIVLEVGLGGRLDAVNVVEPDIAVITNIAIDHEAWLGTSREQIAREKAGILRAAIPAVIGDLDPPESLCSQLDKLACHAHWPKAGWEKTERAAEPGPVHGFSIRQEALQWCGVDANGKPLERTNLPRPVLSRSNWSMALQVVALLTELPESKVIAGLMQCTALPGRQSLHVCQDRTFLLDVAHNPDSIGRLSQRIAEMRDNAAEKASRQKIFVVYAAMQDKDILQMLHGLMPVVDQWIFPQLADCPRALPANELLTQWQQLAGGRAPDVSSEGASAQMTDSVAEALRWTIQNSQVNDKIIVCGSFVTAGEALDFFNRPDA